MTGLFTGWVLFLVMEGLQAQPSPASQQQLARLQVRGTADGRTLKATERYVALLAGD